MQPMNVMPVIKVLLNICIYKSKNVNDLYAYVSCALVAVLAGVSSPLQVTWMFMK